MQENVSPARYQLVRTFINVIAGALVVAWYLNKSQLIIFLTPLLS